MTETCLLKLQILKILSLGWRSLHHVTKVSQYNRHFLQHFGVKGLPSASVLGGYGLCNGLAMAYPGIEDTMESPCEELKVCHSSQCPAALKGLNTYARTDGVK